MGIVIQCCQKSKRVQPLQKITVLFHEIKGMNSFDPAIQLLGIMYIFIGSPCFAQ